MITETLLQDNEEDDQWAKSFELNTNGYQIQTINRINERRSNCTNHKNKAKLQLWILTTIPNFEHKIWNVQFKLKPTYLSPPI